MPIGKRTPHTETLATVTPLPIHAEPPQQQPHPLFGVALLKIALELKKHDARTLDQIVNEVGTRMRLELADFKTYLKSNLGLIQTLTRGSRS